MKNLTFALLVAGIFFSGFPTHVTYAGPYEDCLAGKIPYPANGTEASCAKLKGLSTGGSETTLNPREAGPASPELPAAPRGAGPASPENPGAQGDLSYSLQNPLAFDSLEGFVVAILNVIIVIATPIVVIFIILAGFKYVTARGNATQVQEATRALTYAIIGGVLIIGAVAIAEIIKDLVTSFS